MSLRITIASYKAQHGNHSISCNKTTSQSFLTSKQMYAEACLGPCQTSYDGAF